MQNLDLLINQSCSFSATQGKPKKKHGKKPKKNDEFEATFTKKLYQASGF